MTTESMVEMVVRYVQRLYHRRWESWELLALGFVALIVAIQAIRSHRKTTCIEKHLHERTPDARLQKLRDL